jgi:protein SCO1/2
VVICAVVAGGLTLSACGSGATRAPDAPSAGGLVAKTTSDDAFHGTLMDPPRPRPDLQLPTADGTLFDFQQRPDDEVTVLFFGYTHCPDLCPTTMADLNVARDMLPDELRDRVRVVFVTEDPARDTPKLLRDWLDRFEPEFTGLIGGNEATAAALASLYLPETEQVADPSTSIVHPHDGGEQSGDGHRHGDYSVDHAGIVYTWSPDGRSVIYTGGTTPEQYAEDFTRLATAP